MRHIFEGINSANWELGQELDKDSKFLMINVETNMLSFFSDDDITDFFDPDMDWDGDPISEIKKLKVGETYMADEYTTYMRIRK